VQLYWLLLCSFSRLLPLLRMTGVLRRLHRGCIETDPRLWAFDGPETLHHGEEQCGPGVQKRAEDQRSAGATWAMRVHRKRGSQTTTIGSLGGEG